MFETEHIYVRIGEDEGTVRQFSQIETLIDYLIHCGVTNPFNNMEGYSYRFHCPKYQQNQNIRIFFANAIHSARPLTRSEIQTIQSALPKAHKPNWTNEGF